jgi:hypothetical protein
MVVTLNTSRIPKVILLIESSRASGRALLKGVADYVNQHERWSFYWEPGGLEKAWPTLRTIGADGIILRDVEKVEEALASGLPAVAIGNPRHDQRRNGFGSNRPVGRGTLAALRLQAFCLLRVFENFD